MGRGTLGGGYESRVFYGTSPHSFYLGRPIFFNDDDNIADSLSILAIGNYMKSQEDYDILSESIQYLHINRAKKIAIVYSISDNPMAISDYCFDNSVYLNAILYVPIGSKEKYISTTGWKNFLWSWSAKGNTAKDGAASGGFCVILLLVAAFTVLFVVSEMKSCSSRGPSSDYYDAPRK